MIQHYYQFRNWCNLFTMSAPGHYLSMILCNLWHLLSLVISISSLSETYCPYIDFPCQFSFCCLCCSSLNYFGCVEFTLGTVMLAHTAIIKVSIWCLTYRPKLFSSLTIKALHKIEYFPPLPLKAQSPSISLFGCNFIFVVVPILTLWFISSSLFFSI